MADHRDFKRDRETHRDRDRDRGIIDYDRDRFDRERRPRDDRYVGYEKYLCQVCKLPYT